MATGLAKPTTLTSAGAGAGERVIRSQLRRASQYVKWVEAGSQLLTLLIGTLVFFLTAALIDHWVLSLGWFGRWTLCLAYLGGCGWFLATRLLPLLLRAVNPTYSARAIEEAQPTLKNSLVNFLLLKQDHAGVKESVIDAMEQRAASDIATVEVDSAIDRTPLIRMGYVLCGVMAVVALYKIASPKDPFQTAARVVAPWREIARPSRVLIREVQPGHTSVYLGSQVEVTADIQGLRGMDEVQLIYSSADGQVHDRVILMKNGAGGSRYTAMLPAEENAGGNSRRGATGLQQGVQYHVAAGDALSSIYEIRVRLAPTIAVEKADLNFPAYTQKAPQSQPTGEIKALEGTRVTIHARANQPIKTAVLEFDPKPGRTPERFALQVDGQDAVGTFTLQLKSDRATPWRETYHVRFTNEQGEMSEQPVLHRIEVTPDLPPEVEILSPRLQKVDLPADSRMTIEARGVDPDFALFDLFVAGKVAGGQIFRKSLLPPNESRSQATGKVEFVPADYDLKPGAIVTYQGVAIDNRRDPLTGQPQPGRAETAEYTIQITPPRKPQPNDPNAAQRPKEPGSPGAEQNPAGNPPMPKPGDKPQPMPGANNQPMPMPGDQSNQPNQEKPEQKPQQPGEPNQPMPPKPQEPMSGSQNSGKPSSGQSGSGQGQSSEGSGNQAQPGQGTGGQNSNNQQSNMPPMPGESPSGNSGQSGSQNQQNQAGQNGPNQNSDPNGGQSGSPSGAQSGGQPQSGTGQNAPGNQGGTGQDQPEGDNTGGPGDPTGRAGGNNAQPSDRKPQHDGEKLEKFLDILKDESKQAQQQKQRGAGGSKQPGEQQPGEQQPSNSADQNQNQAGNNAQQPNPGTGKPQSAKPASGKPGEIKPGENKPGENEVTEQQLKDIEQMLKEKRAQEGQAGQPKPNETASGKPNNEQSGGQPQPMEQQPMGQQAGGNSSTKPRPQPNGNQPQGAQPNGSQGAGNPPMGNQPMGQQPKPGEQGTPQNNAGQQPNDSSKGGEPKGQPKNEGRDPSSKPGEQKNPGAGNPSDPGAGQQSQDPNGSGQAQEQNQNTKKETKPGEAGAPKSSDPGSNSTSKKQSDSQGSQGGDQSGGGQQGGGQSTGQQGNDSPGGSSAADEGAGAAKEQGKGETGNKAGKGPEAAGKTGQSGRKPGEGSATKPGEKGTETGKGQAGKQPGTKPGEKPQPGQSSGEQPGPGAPAGGGAGGDVSGGSITKSSADVADEANLNYTRKVTDLVLERLRDQEHNPDPELAKRANLTPQELQEFARRWSQLKKDAETDPNKARELDEALRSLGLKDPKNRRRAGATVNDKQRDLRDAAGRTQAPSKYREQFDQFRKNSSPR